MNMHRVVVIIRNVQNGCDFLLNLPLRDLALDTTNICIPFNSNDYQKFINFPFFLYSLIYLYVVLRLNNRCFNFGLFKLIVQTVRSLAKMSCNEIVHFCCVCKFVCWDSKGFSLIFVKYHYSGGEVMIGFQLNKCLRLTHILFLFLYLFTFTHIV